MGNILKNNNESMNLDFLNYSKMTIFSLEEVKIIYKQYTYFSKLDIDDGTIDFQEFIQVLNINDSLFSKQLFKIFDENEDNKINFREYLLGISLLLEENFDKQVNVFYRLINIDDKEYITINDMFNFISDSISNYKNINIPHEILKKNIINTLKISLKHIKPKKDKKLEKKDSNWLEDFCFIENNKIMEINNNFNLEDIDNLKIDKELFSYFVRLSEQFTIWISLDFELLINKYKNLLN